MSSVSSTPVLSNCGTPTEKVSEYLDQILKPITKENWSADVVDLYPSIPHKSVLETLRRRINERETPKISTEDIGQMTEFVLKHIFLSSMGEFAPPSACIFKNEVETEFLKSQELQPFFSLCYIDNIFFI